MTTLGCIADDFTGATDLAALLARSGARVALRIGLPAAPATDAAECEVVALKIRSAPAPEAVAQALAALDWLQAAGARRFYWKYCSTFDSTPQGNIGPVAEALMAALGTDRTLHAPSFPENGRRVFMGNLFVGRQPLAEIALACGYADQSHMTHALRRDVGMTPHALRALSRLQAQTPAEAHALTILPVEVPNSRRPIGLTTRSLWEPTALQREFLAILHEVARKVA